MDKITHKIEFLIALSVFLPVTIDALYKIDVLAGKDVILNWGVIIGILILSYLLVSFKYSNIRNEFHENAISICILTNIFFYVPLLTVVGYSKGGVIYFPLTYVMTISLYALFWLPVVLFVLILFLPIIIDGLETYREDARNGIYRKMRNTFLSYLKSLKRSQ